MELYFNELSLPAKNNSSLCIDKISLLIGVRRAVMDILPKKENVVCRICDNEYNVLFKYLGKLVGTDSRAGNIRNLMYSFFQRPYDKNVSSLQGDRYLAANWQCDGSECLGLALAYTCETFSLSYYLPRWDCNVIGITRDDDVVHVNNLCDPEKVKEHGDNLQEMFEVELRVTVLAPDKKPIKLRDDHGKDKLQKFAERIVNCEYVETIINSLPFNSREKNFIHEVYSDGRVELVLTWTDSGYGMVVQTTGRNLRETKKIAQIIKERYEGV